MIVCAAITLAKLKSNKEHYRGALRGTGRCIYGVRDSKSLGNVRPEQVHRVNASLANLCDPLT